MCDFSNKTLEEAVEKWFAVCSPPENEPYLAITVVDRVNRIALGTSKAARRVRSLERRPNPIPPMLAATEACMWLAAFEEQFINAPDPIPTWFWEKRDHCKFGRAQKGLRWARNHLVHEGTNFIGLITCPVRHKPVVGWKQQMHARGHMTPDNHDRDKAYGEYVAGRPVSEPITETFAFFQRITRELIPGCTFAALDQ